MNYTAEVSRCREMKASLKREAAIDLKELGIDLPIKESHAKSTA